MKTQHDPYLLYPLFLLCCLGLLMVFSASMPTAAQVHQDGLYYVKRHGLYLLLGVFAFSAGRRISLKSWEKATPLLFALVVILLALVWVPGLGVKINGAHRWIRVGAFTLQPAEFAKFFLVVYLASSFSRHPPRQLHDLTKPLMVIGLIAGMIVLQPDLGTALFCGLLFALLLFVSGFPARHLAVTGLIGMVVLGAAIFTKGYRSQRLMGFLRPTEHLDSVNYQPYQSVLAIGSGGMTGVGLGRSRQKHFYLPQPHTDFIFAVLAEELGFVGTLVVLSLYAVFILRGIVVSSQHPYRLAKLMGLGVVGWIGLQAAINLAVAMHLAPVTGIPLPFLSYGGTALVANLLCAGVLLRISGGKEACAESQKGHARSRRDRRTYPARQMFG